MTAGHCCGTRDTKAICGGKLRTNPTKLGESVDMRTATFGSNDFCLLKLGNPVHSVPIYEVAVPEDVTPKDAIIVGYGVVNSGVSQTGSGIQREGLVAITRVNGNDISVTGRPGQTYQNACNGDSGGPIFVEKADGGRRLVVGGVTSRGSLYCPQGSTSIYTSAVVSGNANLITSASRDWLGSPSEIIPGRCPVTNCCYSMICSEYNNATKY